MAILGGAFLCGCAAQLSPAAAVPEASILAASRPAAGSTVRGPVDELRFRFDPPARLEEVTVSGPDCVMPAMVHAVGEVRDYSVPVSLDAGAYTVDWRASARGRSYRGSFAFTVR